MPAVPFHKLKDLHHYTAPHSAVTENGFLRFHGKVAAALNRKKE